jgi:hypothetical protein
MDKKQAIKEVKIFHDTYGPGAYDHYICNYDICETKFDKDILVLKLIDKYFNIKSKMTETEWKELIVAPVEDSILCLEDMGMTWEDYYKYVEENDMNEEEEKKVRAKKMEERRKLRQAEKKKFKDWFREIKQDFPPDTDYMSEGLKRGQTDTTDYSKLQLKIIGSISTNAYNKEDRLFWNGFRQGLISRNKEKKEEEQENNAGKS